MVPSLLFIVVLLLSTTSAIEPTKPATEAAIVAPALLSLDAVPPCFRKCSEEYFTNLENHYLAGNLESFMVSSCSSLPNVVRCLNATCEVKVHRNFAIGALSGIEYLCSQAQTFAGVLPCSKVYAHISERCSHCNLYKSTRNLLNSKEVRRILRKSSSAYEVLSYAGDFCGNFTCSLFCMRDYVDTYCMKNGAKFVEVFLRPLSRLYATYMSSAPEDQRILNAQLPKQCRRLMTKDTLKTLFFDDDFIRELNEWVVAHKRAQLERAHRKKNPTTEFKGIKDPFLEFLKSLERPFYYGFIPFCLVLNLIALVISIIYCVRTTESVRKASLIQVERNPGNYIDLRKKTINHVQTRRHMKNL
ncbi:unnamed protein product, partial [Mesorhabditis belari]|uniref:Uncharacterized protein n=1 Tax=Mesorhabditis belari TaxID=2138241 RepID=A0AAF3JBQ6_9BILA